MRASRPACKIHGNIKGPPRRAVVRQASRRGPIFFSPVFFLLFFLLPDTSTKWRRRQHESRTWLMRDSAFFGVACDPLDDEYRISIFCWGSPQIPWDLAPPFSSHPVIAAPRRARPYKGVFIFIPLARTASICCFSLLSLDVPPSSSCQLLTTWPCWFLSCCELRYGCRILRIPKTEPKGAEQHYYVSLPY